ncbi:MAG: methyltransferase [Chloroflexota bacterium]
MPITISRILFILFIINEAVVVMRSSAEERDRLKVPMIVSLSLILLLLPFFIVLALPDWLGWIAVIVQAAGLALEIVSELQLVRAQSFKISADAPQNVQTNMMYRWLENPIYIGILFQVIGWAFWMPLVIVSLFFMYQMTRSMVSAERKYLQTLNAVHRGVDSFLWN